MPPKTSVTIKSKNTKLIKGKKKGKGKQKQKRHKLNLKGWLKTPADWAKFNAWVKVNGLPRKIPEPEPIIRESRPLSQLKKRLEIISKPSVKFNIESICRLDNLTVSKAALKAKPSKRIKKLAMFIWKDEEIGKEVPNPITKAALNYKPSARILEISKPHLRIIESCKDLEISKNALKHKTTKREKKMSLAKKVKNCPNSLTDNEIERLFTPEGIKKSALNYQITDWVSILALPSYRFLKDRQDSDAKKMKKQLEETEDRGKTVLEEQLKKEEEEENKKKTQKKKNKKRKKSSSKPEEENEKTKNDVEKAPEDEETKKRNEERKKERKKWRTEPGPCKTNLSISKAARNAKASTRTIEIAKPHIHVSKACRSNAFQVKKSALKASASTRLSGLAKPMRPLDPVEKPPPREKDAFGSPIFPKPKFGKRMPKVKPYKMKECKDKDANKDETEDSKKIKRKIKPVSLFPSIDPCVDPIGAKKQQAARKSAEENKKDDKNNENK